MGQVWSKANFDGIDTLGNRGGRGSVLAVTAQNPGADGQWGTGDDLLTPLNQDPADVSIDWAAGPNDRDLNDRVRGFFSQHADGAIFAFGDASTRFISESIDIRLYRHLSTRAGSEVINELE
jgi:hypothetical protein